MKELEREYFWQLAPAIGYGRAMAAARKGEPNVFSELYYQGGPGLVFTYSLYQGTSFVFTWLSATYFVRKGLESFFG